MISTKLRHFLHKLADHLELVVSLIVAIGVLIAIVNAVMSIPVYWNQKADLSAFNDFLEMTFNVIVGIEFFKLLCRPHTGHMIETLIFLLSRRLIAEHSTPLEALLIVLSICILFFFRRFMLATKPGENDNMEGFFRFFKR